jgi:hypothetical protein
MLNENLISLASDPKPERKQSSHEVLGEEMKEVEGGGGFKLTSLDDNYMNEEEIIKNLKNQRVSKQPNLALNRRNTTND